MVYPARSGVYSNIAARRLIKISDQGISSKMNKWWWKADFNETAIAIMAVLAIGGQYRTYATCDGVGVGIYNSKLGFETILNK
jgi:hypothetical protein